MDAIIGAATLDAFVAPLDALVDEVKLQTSPDGFRARAVDPANVAQADVRLDSSGCESLEADDGVLGLGLEAFVDATDFADAGDLVWLEHTADRKLAISAGPLDYEQALIDPDAIRQEPSGADHGDNLTADVRLTGERLATALDGAALVDDIVQLRAAPDGEAITVAGEGDTDDASVTYGVDELQTGQIDAETWSLYSLDYFQDIAAPIPDDASVRLRWGDDWPAVVEYEAADGYVSVVYTIAPRIETGGGT
jgi:proliferating cell nuclear antigen